MERILLYLLSRFLLKVLPIENSIALFISDKDHIEELQLPTNYLFTNDLFLVALQQNGTERHPDVTFFYSTSDKSISLKVISNESHFYFML